MRVAGNVKEDCGFELTRLCILPACVVRSSSRRNGVQDRGTPLLGNAGWNQSVVVFHSMPPVTTLAVKATRARDA